MRALCSAMKSEVRFDPAEGGGGGHARLQGFCKVLQPIFRNGFEP